MKQLYFIAIICACLVVSLFVVGFAFLQKHETNEPPETDDPQPNQTDEPESLTKDSDGDGLIDKEEKEVYKTDPAKKDTDGDEINDYEEVMGSYASFLDPLKPNPVFKLANFDRRLPLEIVEQLLVFEEDGVMDESEERLIQTLVLYRSYDNFESITKSILGQEWVKDGLSDDEHNVIYYFYRYYTEKFELGKLILDSSWFKTTNAKETRVIISYIKSLDTQISELLENQIANLPANPHLKTEIENKIAILQDPDLIPTIIREGHFCVGFFSSSGGIEIQLFTVFPVAEMRSDAYEMTQKLKLALPCLEDFLGAYPYGDVRLYYGFKIGSNGGGGQLYMEDKAAYENRRSPEQLTTLPYDAILYHELSHTYIGQESLNQFLDIYTYNLINEGSYNIEDWTYSKSYETDKEWATGYVAILEIYRLIGHDRMSEAYRVIWPTHPAYGQPLSAECIQAFVDHAPVELKAQVSELASRITP